MTSSAELLLSVQLEQAGIPFEREFRFAPPRRFRADFMLNVVYELPPWRNVPILVEIEGGSFTGGHKRGMAYESDCEKNNLAMDKAYRVYRFTPRMVDDGRALAVIRQALGLERAA